MTDSGREGSSGSETGMFFSAELPEVSSVPSLACSSGVLGFTELKGGSVLAAGVLSDYTGDRLPSGLVTDSGREGLG